MNENNAICIWCKNAEEKYGGCGIRCGVNGFICDGMCEDYEPLPFAGEALDLLKGEALLDSVNDVKWRCREIGGPVPLLAAAVIDALQEAVEDGLEGDLT